MKKLITGSVLAAVLAVGGIQFGAPAQAEAAKKGKRTICHNGHEITVNRNSLPAHAAHGDTRECPE